MSHVSSHVRCSWSCRRVKKYHPAWALQDLVASLPPAVTTSPFECYGKQSHSLTSTSQPSDDRSSSTELPPSVCQVSSPSPVTRSLEFCIPTVVAAIAELLSKGATSPGWTIDQQLIQVIHYVGVRSVVELECAEDRAND
uniref:Uncharacterized protein n=1 Tax=Catagonus wagneri TaxID=51154 RepID=A0A8C3YJU8_9CETA